MKRSRRNDHLLKNLALGPTWQGWSQSVLAAKLQIAGFDISRSGVSKIEARLSYVDDKALLYLAEVLKVQLQELFPTRPPGNRIYDFIEKFETTRF
jgi:transcriptional regulator with XRE-family HTH domain